MRKGHWFSDDLGGIDWFGGWDASFATRPSAATHVAAEPNPLEDSGDPYPLAAETLGATTNADSTKSVASIAQLADYLVNGFWAYNSALPHHWGSNTISYNINGLNADERALARSALVAWHDVANVNFVETTGAANITFVHTGTMIASTSATWTSAGLMTSATIDISSDWITTDGGAQDGKTGIDSYGYQTYIHEVGHALGLGHQGPYNGSASYSPNAIYANDTWQYSILSYFAEDNYSGSSYRYVITPQMADIYAAGLIYGAATTTRTGDTIYGFNSNANGIFNFSNFNPAPALTIYDSGGSDTLDASGYGVAQTIDLHPGAFSSVGGLVNNIGIATNTIIETAIGGGGNDTLIASDYGSTLVAGAGSDTMIGGAGGDRLVAGSGADNMRGNGGADTFVFAAGDVTSASGNHDLISDFAPGLDRIDLSGIDAKSATSGYDPFSFFGTAAFNNTAGELNYYYNGALNVTVLQGDWNGDSVADFAIDLTGSIVLDVTDLVGAISFSAAIESTGTTNLTQVASNYFLNPAAGGIGPSLKYAGSLVVAGAAAPWFPIAAEQTASGYDIAWKDATSGQFSIWTTDSSGNFTSFLTGAVSGTSTTLENLESVFHQDLNGDGTIGVPVSVVVESAGSTTLTQVGNHYALYASGTTNGPILTYGGSPVVVGQVGTWSLIGAEQTATGYDVAWKDSSSGQFSIWTTDSNGSFTAFLTGAVSGTSATLKSYEPIFQQDLNGDGTTGMPPTAIESIGSTSLVVSGNNYYLSTSGSGPSLKIGGTPIVIGQAGTWSPVAAEQVGGGYDVAWKDSSTGQFSIWSTDANGNFTAYLTGAVSGTSVTLENLESVFHQDLNGDGTIGVPVSVAVESAGSTTLTQVGNHYALYASGTTSGPILTYSGSPVVVGQAGTWSVIGAEQTATGYDVAWKDSSSGQFSIWSTDANGNFTAFLTGAVSGTSATLKSYEPIFHQDLNGDGTTGAQMLASATAAATISSDNSAFTTAADHLSTLHLDHWHLV